MKARAQSKEQTAGMVSPGHASLAQQIAETVETIGCVGARLEKLTADPQRAVLAARRAREAVGQVEVRLARRPGVHTRRH